MRQISNSLTFGAKNKANIEMTKNSQESKSAISHLSSHDKKPSISNITTVTSSQDPRVSRTKSSLFSGLKGKKSVKTKPKPPLGRPVSKIKKKNSSNDLFNYKREEVENWSPGDVVDWMCKISQRFDKYRGELVKLEIHGDILVDCLTRNCLVDVIENPLLLSILWENIEQLRERIN